MKSRVFFTPVAAIAAAAILYLAIVTDAQAHRLSGHPRTVREQLRQARLQILHDRLEDVHHWLQRDLAYVRRLLHPPHEWAWWCIHRGEGAWNDPAAPYYGGLQMDHSFMRAYGGWHYRLYGTADHWTPLEQMWVAERALRAGRGFYPWPNTARACGLIG